MPRSGRPVVGSAGHMLAPLLAGHMLAPLGTLLYTSVATVLCGLCACLCGPAEARNVFTYLSLLVLHLGRTVAVPVVPHRRKARERRHEPGDRTVVYFTSFLLFRVQSLGRC